MQRGPVTNAVVLDAALARARASSASSASSASPRLAPVSDRRAAVPCLGGKETFRIVRSEVAEPPLSVRLFPRTLAHEDAGRIRELLANSASMSFILPKGAADFEFIAGSESLPSGLACSARLP